MKTTPEQLVNGADAIQGFHISGVHNLEKGAVLNGIHDQVTAAQAKGLEKFDIQLKLLTSGGEQVDAVASFDSDDQSRDGNFIFTVEYDLNGTTFWYEIKTSVFNNHRAEEDEIVMCEKI